MFTVLFIAHAVVGGTLTLWVSYAATRIGWLWRRRTLDGLRRGVRAHQRFTAVFFALLLAMVVIGGGLLKFQSSFGQAWLIVALTLLVAAAGGLWGGARLRLEALAEAVAAAGAQPEGVADTPPADELRAQAAAPALVVPTRAAALWVWAVLYLMLERPALVQSLVVGVLAVLAAVSLRAWQTLAGPAGRRLGGRIADGPTPDGQSGGGMARVARGLAVPLALLVGVAGWALWSWGDSLLPGVIPMAAPAAGDMAGMPGMRATAAGGGVNVATLTGPATGVPDDSFILTAADQRVRLASGAVATTAVTFNGQAPGPTLTVHQGDLVQVKLVNHSSLPTSLHWHGVRVPNAEDGVPGVTQNAVKPGGSMVYRFRVPDAGTYWYHSHEQSSTQVRRGLFGPLVVLPRGQAAASAVDEVVTAHTWATDHGDRPALGGVDGEARQTVRPGQQVRLRLLNTDNVPAPFTLVGAPFRVAAIDGADVTGATPLTAARVQTPAGGRYDLTFTMPTTPVALVALDRPSVRVTYAPPGVAGSPAVHVGANFALDGYGTPTAATTDDLTLASHFTRNYTIDLDQRPGFHDGVFDTHLFMINGRLDPDVPPFMITQGDLVKLTFVNRTVVDHPFHLHGHRLTVLSHNGKALTGARLSLDTLNLEPGSTWVVAFRADNPGLWMFHCHNLNHAATGMMAMFDYTGYGSGYMAGRDTGNIAE